MVLGVCRCETMCAFSHLVVTIPCASAVMLRFCAFCVANGKGAVLPILQAGALASLEMNPYFIQVLRIIIEASASNLVCVIGKVVGRDMPVREIHIFTNGIRDDEPCHRNGRGKVAVIFYLRGEIQ